MLRSRIHRRDLLKALLAAGAPAPAAAEGVTVFRAGTDGYHTYRIPAILRTPKGTILAFAEGRRDSRSDTGDIDIVVKRSSDGGRTWSAQERIADLGRDTIGNPCPVLDRRTGTILLTLTANPGTAGQNDIVQGRGTRTVWISEGHDDGRRWSAPREITRAVKGADWTWYATGPGVGIQLRDGRLVIPCDHRRGGSDTSYSHAMTSADGGRTWRSGQAVGEKTNECQVVELRGGDLLMNMRSFHGQQRRATARSRDGGATWTDLRHDEALVEPPCQASLIVHGRGRRRVLLFANPAAPERVRMTVRVSRDEGRTWAGKLTLHEGPSAYSSLVDLGGGDAGCLFERGERGPYEEIGFMRFAVRTLVPA
jgi:sialidase-1